jgi:hypothetical protein
VAFAAAIVAVVADSGFPVCAAATYLGLHGVVYCRRLAPYTGPTKIFRGSGLMGEVASPLFLAVRSGTIMLMATGGVTLYIVDWLGIADVQNNFSICRRGYCP